MLLPNCSQANRSRRGVVATGAVAIAGLAAAGIVLTGHPARAQQAGDPQDVFVQPEGVDPANAQQLPPDYAPPPDPSDQYPGPSPEADASEGTLIPPNVEGPAMETDGGYCYVGPHPVDTRIVPGVEWDDTQGQHVRPYPPIDMRLFALRDGCYYFVGDPRDFGYAGQTYSYYGAHPVLDAYGGGWCFMMGAHTHVWSPWSPYFTVVGPWYYWHGPYDPFFWAYWPYYSFYYRTYYPHYYAGGRFYRGGGYAVAPPIRSFPSPRWRGSAAARTAPTVRGAAPTQMLRSGPGGPVMTAPARSSYPAQAAPYGSPNRGVPAPAYRGSAAPPAPAMMAPSHTFRAAPPAANAPVRSFSSPTPAPVRSFSPAPSSRGGGFTIRGGGRR